MKYTVIFIMLVLLAMPQAFLQAQDGADEDELEILKEAWKRHSEEKEDEGAEGEPGNALEALRAIEGKMRSAERRLSREDPGSKTIEKQREALELLDDLIKYFFGKEQAQPPSKGGGSEKKSEPKPGETPGEPKPGRLTDPSRGNSPATPGMQRKKQMMGKKDDKKELRYKGRGGKLKDRWDVLRGSSKLKELEEGFNEKRPPKYERLVDEYFRRLLQGSGGR